MKFLNTFLLLLSFQLSFGADKLIVQRGHSDELLYVAVDPNGKTYATASRDKTVKVWDLQSGKLITTVTGFSFYVTKVGYSPEGKFIYMRGDLGTCKVISTTSFEEVTHLFYDDFFPITQLTFGINDDMLLFGTNGSAYVVNTNSWKKYLIPGRVGGDVDALTFNKSTKKVFVRAKGGTGADYDVASILSKEDFHLDRLPAEYYPFKAELADGKVLIKDKTGSEIAKRNQPVVRVPVAAKFSPDNSTLVIGFEDMNDIVVWSLKENNMRRIKMPAKENRAITFSSDGTTLFVGSGKELFSISIAGTQTLLTTNGTISCVDVSPDGKSLIVGTKEGELQVYDFLKKSVVANVKLGKTITSASIHPKGKIVAIALNGQGAVFKYPALKEDNVPIKGNGTRMVDYSGDGKFLAAQDAKTKKVVLYESGKEEPARSIKDPSEHVTKSEAAILTQLFPIQFSNKDGWLVSMGEEWIMHLRKAPDFQDVELKGHSSWANSFSFSSDDRFLISTSDDGSVRIWNLQTQKEEAILVFNEKDFVVAASDNYYFTSKNGYDLIGFFSNGTIYPFEQFDLYFNRPDIILKRLGCTNTALITAYENAWKKRCKKNGFTDLKASGVVPPQIEIIDKHKFALSGPAGKVEFKVNASDKNYSLDRILVWINDVPVWGRNGLSVKTSNSRTSSQTIKLDLVEGVNKIEVAAVNSNGVESYRQQLFIERTVKVPEKRKIFYVGIGSGKFKESGFNLNYPEKDITDFLKILEEIKGTKYVGVESKLYANDKVSTAMLKEIRKFLLTAGRNDLVILFFAGHGVLDADFNYFLSAYDMNFNQPSSGGIEYSALENVLDSIAPLDKLFLIDACHSGETDKEEMQFSQNGSTEKSADVAFRNVGPAVERKTGLGNQSSSELIKEMFADIRRGTGATVISSAGGAEYAMESDTWKNGLFTYCVLNGLKSGAADADGDQHIRVTELIQYVSKEVTHLSGGGQHPTSRAENISLDFIIK